MTEEEEEEDAMKQTLLPGELIYSLYREMPVQVWRAGRPLDGSIDGSILAHVGYSGEPFTYLSPYNASFSLVLTRWGIGIVFNRNTSLRCGRVL